MDDDPKRAVTLPLGPVGRAVRSPSPVAPTEPPGSETLPGHGTPTPELERLGRFEVKSKLGEGGMGVVLLATDPQLGRRVALKVLRRELDSSDARRRLLREAQGIAQLTHENVIVVHEVGSHDGHDYVAMEYVPGGTLTEWQVGKSWQDIVAMYARAGRGLAAAHDAGLVHRDFKPDNVLVGADGRVRVSDFGLVAAVGETPELSKTQRELRGESELAVSLTRTGSIMGTPRYMAPEQHLGQDVDPRADQFAFCAALFEALFGRPPFAADSYPVLVAMALAGEIGDIPADSPVPATLRDAILRGLSPQRDDRFPSMRELLEVLEPAPTPVEPPAPPRRASWLLLGVGAAVAIGASIAIGALLVGRNAEDPPADVPVRTAADWKRQGDAEIEAGNFASAAQALENARKLDPSLDVDHALAGAYLESKNCPAARATFDRWIARMNTSERAKAEVEVARSMAPCEPRIVVVSDPEITVLEITYDANDEPNPELAAALAKLAKRDLLYDKFDIWIRVNTGDVASRQRHADRRARAVTDALVARGVRRSMINAVGRTDAGAPLTYEASSLALPFGPDDQLLPSSQATVDMAVQEIRRDPPSQDYEIIISMQETPANVLTARARANRRGMAIRDHLIAAGVAPKRVNVGTSVAVNAKDGASIFRKQ